MSNVVNWKTIGLFAAALVTAEFMVGFITGGLEGAELRVAASFALSLVASAVLFWLMAARQHRPFLHASLTLLLAFVFSLALGAVIPAWLVQTPPLLAVLEWVTLALGLVIGVFIARYALLRRARAGA